MVYCTYCYQANDLQKEKEIRVKHEQKRKEMAIVLPKQRKAFVFPPARVDDFTRAEASRDEKYVLALIEIHLLQQ